MTSPTVERLTHVRQEHPEGWRITAVATPQGEFVRYSDYERLSAELARARAERDRAALVAADEANRADAAEAECDRLAADNARLKRLVPSDRWYWPEDDTSSDACADNPREALEYQKPGEIGGYSCGGVAYTNYFGWLPPADDADSDDEFEVDEPTREAAKEKMDAEIARRTALAGKD